MKEISPQQLKGHRVNRVAFLSVALLVAWLPIGWAQAPPAYIISTPAGATGVLSGPLGVAVDSSGNLYIADQFNNVVRELSGSTLTTVAGNGTGGYSGDGGAPTSAELDSPSGVALDSSGNLYIADSGNAVVRKVSGGKISTVAGNNASGHGFSGDGGLAINAQLTNPSSLAVDSSGNIYIADPMNDVVRVVCQNQTPAPCAAISSFVAGDITTFAGNEGSGAGYSGDGGPSTGALLNNPVGVALDSHGNLYIADTSNELIRKVTPAGIISTVAGNGYTGYAGDGGLATQASLNDPWNVSIDAVGNVFIADRFNSVIRVIEPNGNITTVAGIAGAEGYTGDGGPATSATLDWPTGVAVSGTNVYIADNVNNVIRLLTAIPAPPHVNPKGVISASQYGAFSTVAPGGWIEIYGVNLAGNTRQWQESDFNGSAAPTSLDLTSVTIGGQSAFVYYISPTQVDVQVPSNVGTGTQPLVVTTEQGSSGTYNVTVAATAPGLLAPASFEIGGMQYAAAFVANSTTLTGMPSQPASPGSTITLYGVGFGAVTPNTPAGQIVAGNDTLVSPVQIFIGGAMANVSYQGLVPSFIGLYQFNLTVPTIPANNAAPLTFTQGGAGGMQTLYIAVAN
jgi:uncharacterized protein (TIGR03437 family)